MHRRLLIRTGPVGVPNPATVLLLVITVTPTNIDGNKITHRGRGTLAYAIAIVLSRHDNYALSPVDRNPNWRQTTAASGPPNAPLQTVPHWPLLQNSRRPMVALEPPTSRKSPS